MKDALYKNAHLFYGGDVAQRESAGLISRRSVDRALPCATSFHPWERCFTLISSVHPAVFKMGTGREDSERIVGCLSCSAYKQLSCMPPGGLKLALECTGLSR